MLKRGLLGVLCAAAAFGAAPAHADAAAPSAEAACTQTLPAGGDIQQAVDSLGPRDGAITLCLAPGDYRLKQPVSILRSHVRLRGAGVQTVLQADAEANGPLLIIGDYHHEQPQGEIDDVAIENLRLIGAGVRGKEFDARYPYLSNSTLVVRGGRHIQLSGLQVGDCRSACVLTEHGTDDIVIEHSDIRGSTWDGLALNRTAHARVINNQLSSNRAAGITAEHLEDSLIAANTLSANGSHGIYLSDSYRNTVRDNRFIGNREAGVFLTCAIRSRLPWVRCWDGSMSAANHFEHNQFIANRYGYEVIPNLAARCDSQAADMNRSERDVFSQDPNHEADWGLYGHCLQYQDPQSG